MKHSKILFISIIVIISIILYFVSTKTKNESATNIESTANNIMYISKIADEDITRIIKENTKLDKLESKDKPNDIKLEPVELSNLSKIKCSQEYSHNINSYPRVAFIGRGSFSAEGNNLIFGNVEISNTNFNLKDGSNWVIFPSLTIGFTSEKIWYEMPFSSLRSENSDLTNVVIDSRLELPIYDDTKEFNCGTISNPFLDLIKTHLVVNKLGTLSLGYKKIDNKTSVNNGFQFDNGTIYLEDSEIQADSISSTKNSIWNITSNVVIEGNIKNNNNLMGKLYLDCKDSRHSSDYICHENDTVLELKNFNSINADIIYNLAFDGSKFSIGLVKFNTNIDLAKTNIVINDAVLSSIDKDSRDNIVKSLINNDLVIMKSDYPIKSIPKLRIDDQGGHIIDHLLNIGKEFYLKINEEEFSIILSIKEKSS